MKVLSLFDGISCAQIALNKAGIKYETYYACEIDPKAIAVTQSNYPNTLQLGNVMDWRYWDIDWESIDLVIGGFPCQSFSFAGKGEAFADPRGQLFFKFLMILNYIKSVNPKVKFLAENVRMKREYLDFISEKLERDPVFINSSLVSAQSRQRYYWFNWDLLKTPENKNILLRDILDDAGTLDKPVYCGAMRGRYIEKGKKETKQRIEVRYDGKANALTTVQKNSLVVYDPDGRPFYDLSEIEYRNLLPEECERLQTIPVGYTRAVGKSHRHRLIGNAFTVDIVAHLLKYSELSPLRE